MTTANIYVCLSESDQKKFGCSDRMRLDLRDTTAREQATLQRAFGYHELQDLSDALRDMFDVDGDGKVTRVRKDTDLYLAFTWLALRHNGHLDARHGDEMLAELADMDFQIAWAQLDFDVDAEGKDESSTPTEISTS